METIGTVNVLEVFGWGYVFGFLTPFLLLGAVVLWDKRGSK